MSCVVTSHPEFVELSKKLNLHPNFLESIVHKYQNSSIENVGKYPSVGYVLDSLKGTSMTNASEGQVKLWEAKFSSPKIFNREKEADAYINEAARYFSAESIVIEQDLEGKYKVTVVEPYTAEYIKEINDILNNASRDSEGRLLAPNGKPSNLTGKQYAQVRTKSFINWFGDWINDSKNASKIVDENEEPLVVYHQTDKDFNIFEIDRPGRGSVDFETPIGIFVKEDTTDIFNNGAKQMPLFANAKNIITFKDRNELVEWLKNNISTYNDYLEELQKISENDPFNFYPGDSFELGRKVKKDIVNYLEKLGYDGFELINDIGAGPTVHTRVLFDSNQIKSATDNIGTFSTTDNNIYHNKKLSDLYWYLYNRYKKYKHLYPSIKKFNEEHGTNFGYNPKTKEITTMSPRIYGVSIYNDRDTKIVAKKRIDRAVLLNYLTSKFNLKLQEVSTEDYNRIVGEVSNCCVVEDTVYIRKNDNLTEEQLIEEFVHPVINALYKSNKTIIDNLVTEATKLFSDLVAQIKLLYKEKGEQVIKEEIVAQVLAKYLNKEISDNGTNTRTISNYIKQLITKIIESLKDLFGEINIDKNTRLIISGSDIKDVFSFSNFAELINSKEIKFNDVLPIGERRDNLSTQEQLKSYTFYSGAAQGSDTEWANAAKELGINVIEYTTQSYDSLSQEWKDKIDREYAEARSFLGKPELPTNSMGGKLTRRDMMQADKADAIFAIAERIVKPGETERSNGRDYTNNTTHDNVQGGTANAVARGILRGIPVYAFDQSDNQWKVWDKVMGEFVVTNEPTLTPKAATIGTRNINDAGRQAIKNIIQNTIDKLQNPEESAILYDETNTTEQQLQQSLDISQKLDNLLSSTKITASEVRDVANKVMYWLSDHITDLQTTPELATKIYGDQYKDVDFSKMSRMEIVKAIGVNNILTKAKQNFSPQQNNFNSRKLVAKARLIQENWEAIVYLASNTFGELESFNISYSDNSVIESVNNEEESYTQNTDSESIQELEGNLQEHWQIESRTQSVITSMSKLVRQAVQHCYILTESVNEEGTVDYTPLLDSWGIKERVPVKDAVNSILRWAQGSITLSDMKNRLREKSKDNPWVTQILSRLDDMSGKEADFQSQFFTVFNKHFQSYDVVTITDDKYITLPSNEFPALKEIVGNISALFKIGEHPLFRLNGINKELYKDFNIVYNELVELTKKDFSALDITDIAKKIAFLANVLGFNTDSDFILSSINRGSLNSTMKALYYINDALTSNLDNPNYNPFDYKSVGSIIGNLRKFLMPFTDKLEDVTAQIVYNDGKMYQSYVTPSYMTKLMQKFHLTGESFIEFIENEFAKYEWFKRDTGDIETGWKNSWLRELVKDSNAREIFAHKVQLNFNRHNYMKNMSDVEYILSVLTEYFSQKPTSSRVPAWFRVPMLSNKPSSEFIRFYSESGSDYKDTITSRLKEVFNQELSRIQTVMQRNFEKGDPEFIKNFDKNGRRFCFLDFMNQYLEGESKNTELGKLLRDKLEGKEIDEVQLSSLATEVIKEAMQTKADAILSDWDNMGIFKAAEKISNIGTNIREALENFIWNDTLAAINIMELTITDPAYYKDAEDLQKRFAQIHSPGIRGNIEATDYDGNPVTDGVERTIYLTDFDGFKSNIIDNLTVVFDRKIATAPESERESLIVLKESIIEQYQKINVADAQAYSSPYSYRKKAFIFGKWSKEAEQVYQRLLEGDYSYTDLQVAFQPLKPFKYSQIEKSSEVENSPMSSLKVPIQNKNSEYLLVMASAILQKEDTGRPNLLRAIYEVMKESAEKNTTKGIDTIQFTSAVKSGLMGEIDLTEFLEDENGEAKAKERIKASIYDDGISGEYDKIYVHETPFEDYCIQQETPAHFKNHEQAHGSQIRYIIPSDLEEVNYEGNPVTYEVEGRKLTAQQFKDEYEATIAKNIQESINNLISELNLQGTRQERNIALRNILQKEILGNPRYGVELLQACELDANGEFRIPLGDPIQSKRVEQLINSIIKNRINKQTIAGGPVVQVSNFGTSKQLNIRFKDKKGELLQTRKEFEGTDVEYKKYITENQAGIAYFECFAPAYTDTLFSNFMDADGNIDIKAIEALNPELLKMVGYRI